MNKKLLVLPLVLAVGVLTLSGCAKSLTDKMTEDLIEKSTGGQANVDVSEGNMNIDVEGMNLQVGDNVKLPDNFPKDVYLPENKLLSAVTNEKSYTLTFEVSEKAQETYDTYQEKLKAENWKILATGSFNNMLTLTAEKENRMLSLIVNTPETGKTTVSLSEYLKN